MVCPLNLNLTLRFQLRFYNFAYPWGVGLFFVVFASYIYVLATHKLFSLVSKHISPVAYSCYDGGITTFKYERCSFCRVFVVEPPAAEVASRSVGQHHNILWK